jgi:hypothetical protein
MSLLCIYMRKSPACHIRYQPPAAGKRLLHPVQNPTSGQSCSCRNSYISPEDRPPKFFI